MNNLKTVLSLLKSEKSKDRQQGVSSLREIFSRNSVIDSLDAKGDGRAWLVVYQALFTNVVTERATVTKPNSTAAAERRLKDSASVLRWLTERSVSKWGNKVAKALVKHLLQGMVHNKLLFAPVALDYVKSLRVLCSYQPHLEHLMSDEKQWIDILTMSFNAVLGDGLHSSLEHTPEGQSEAEVDSVLSDDEDEGIRARKRKRTHASERRSQMNRTSRPASSEQIEFAAIIALILRSSRVRLASPEFPNRAQAVLDRLLRFFTIYPVETSAHLDIIAAVNGAVASLSLNAKNHVMNFGLSIWDHLLGLWLTKSRPMKEGVLIALKVLFPYVTLPNSGDFDRVEGVSQLLKHLQADHNSRWCFEELFVASLRFEVSADGNDLPFTAKTFRRGFNFTTEQMTAWAALELQADCVKELYSYSESPPTGGTGKRVKIENPIRKLLHTIQTGRKKSPTLQCLLFVIDRHWSSLHSEIQAEIVASLLQMVTCDDTSAQSWIFCCFAAVAFADTSSESIHWDSIWSHTVRRTNAPEISRAACHASHVLLLCQKVPTHRILAEIEVLGQDITVQGPVATYDSVCAFLTLCMKVSRQDARLYRLHLDDKVLGWFLETWSTSRSFVHPTSSGSNRSRLEQFTIADILSLLEGACGLSESSNFLCPITSPGHPLENVSKDLISTQAIREYLLYARFPDHSPIRRETLSPTDQAPEPEQPVDLVQPEHRERKTSAFLLKMLETTTVGWESQTDDSTRPPVESVRRALDLAVLAICFESSLVMNGIRSNRRSFQAACKLISLLSSFIKDPAWSSQELALLLSSFLPMTSDSIDNFEHRQWDAFLAPTKATGTKYGVADVRRQREAQRELERRKRNRLQSIIWRSTDVQDSVATVLSNIKTVLQSFTDGTTLPSSKSPLSTSTEEKDVEFGPIRTSTVYNLELPANRSLEESHGVRKIVWTCLDILSRASVLQSQEGDAIVDKSIMDLICGCSDDDKLIAVLDPFIWHVQRRNIRLTGPIVDRLLQRIEEPLKTYNYSRSADLCLASVNLLSSTIYIWLAPNPSSPGLGNKIRLLVQWLVVNLKAGDWSLRDSVVRFFDRYLMSDPEQSFLVQPNGDEDSLPATLLPSFLRDDDIRVRLTAAKACARLFSTTYVQNSGEDRDAMTVYGEVNKMLCIDLTQYEHMLTRFICLANIIIISSAVRRGPYWHLIETCLYSQVFEMHIESALSEAAKKMGLGHFSELFEAYASQIAYSIRMSQKDVFCLPPHLLGYRDRRECAEATFAAFSPANLLADLHGEMTLQYGRDAFARHCIIMGKTTADGLQRCFPDILGYQLVSLVDDQLVGGPISTGVDPLNVSLDDNALYEALKARFHDLGLDEELKTMIEKSIDRIVFAILRCNGEMDYRREGPIVKALEGSDKSDRTVRAFRALMKYRGHSGFQVHPPNLPALDITVVVVALKWISSFVESANSHATTYHILYHFFTATAKCILVNEQFRLMTCLCVWISLAHSHFKSVTLLKVLMSGAVSLLPQHDLSAISQGILEWSFIHVKESRVDFPHIVEILIRICTVAYQFRKSPDETVQTTGNRLKDWIEAQVVSLSEVDLLRQRIAIALAAWPDDLSDHLLEIRSNLTISELSRALDDPHLSSKKFKLVRRLAQLSREFDYDEEVFARHDFWRLKDSIPESEIAEEEAEAFTSLLVHQAGFVKSNSTDQQVRSIGIRHQKLAAQKDDKGRRFGHVSVKRPIIMALLDILADQTAAVVDVAYRTLRLLAKIESLDSPEYGSWPSEYRGDIMCLTFCPTEEDDAHPRKLKDLQNIPLETGSNFSIWISEITVFLSSVLSTADAFFAHLSSMLRGSTLFAEQMFPVLVYTLLQQHYVEDGISARATLSDYFKKLLAESALDNRCHRSIVNLVLHLRNYVPGNAEDALQYNRWLDLDYVMLSQSAIESGAYTTSLLFLEIAVDVHPSRLIDTEVSERILYEIYSHIDEPDGFYGIKTQNLHKFLLQRFHHEQQWEKAFQFHGANFEAAAGDAGERDGIIESLQCFGFNHLAIAALQSTPGNEDSTSASSHLGYQLGWRTESWDLPDPPDSGTVGSNLYVALRAVHRERESGARNRIVLKALNDELQYLRTLGNEDLAEIRRVTKNLMSLVQIRSWKVGEFQPHSNTKLENERDLDLDDLRSGKLSYEFQDLESIIATRISLIHSLRQREQREQIGMMQSDLSLSLLKLEKKCLIQLSKAAREANQAQVALNSIIRALQLQGGLDTSVTQEYANVLWLKREQKFAVEFLKRELATQTKTQSNKSPFDKMQNALMLAKLGEWTSEACLEKPDFIHKNHFSPAIALLLDNDLEKVDLGDARATVFHKCAMFAEQQYQTIVQSPELIRLRVYAERKKQELKDREETIKRLQNNRNKLHELTQHQRKAKTLYEQDTAQYIDVSRARDTFLHQAIQMLSSCLEASDSYDGDAAIRLCSLWFANFGSESLNDAVSVALGKVPSRKFVFLAHQLSARLSSQEATKASTDQQALQSLIIRMCSEHPFHSLYQVYALQSGSLSPSSSSRRRSSGIGSEPMSQLDRAAAASDIFQQLHNTPGSSAKVRDVKRLCDAYLEWAKYPIKGDTRISEKKKKKEKLPIPHSLAIRNIANLRVPVTTVHTPLDPTMRYEDCIWIIGYSPDFDTAGGINLPKISNCHGSDGKEYKQLFKGEGDDDLRQDAVMEQVFELCNQVLSHDRETRKRNLLMRSYKVVPLAPQAGLLEFVTNTMPMQSWLGMAHARYHPADMIAKDCSNQLIRMRKESPSTTALVNLFREIRRRFHPVMRHFFTERHKVPQAWFEMRLNYSRSVAVSSIIGHVLGLGDRHISNILLDTSSGEVVHIDLGIAFEQGKLLMIPERVPFRLTADMVDGFGMSGTEGVFRRCAEETLRVLRDGSDVIKTVLEVFKYDPLHSWTASTVKVRKVQADSVQPAHETERLGIGIGINMDSGMEDEAADRALNGVARKLDKSLSVEYTVNELITEATDESNLAQMFAGWSPYC